MAGRSSSRTTSADAASVAASSASQAADAADQAAASAQNAAGATGSGGGAGSAELEFAELKDMLYKGLITQQDYDDKKKQLLEGM